MCRFALYLGGPIRMSTLVSEPEFSILHQSYASHERKEPLNGDGFGVAWYVDGESRPALLREVRPAWNSMNLRTVAAVTHTRCLLAHVRAASPGMAVTQLNCHPFSWNQLTLMHNGHVAGFRHFQQRLVCELREASFLDLKGSTDSEHVFALVREAWEDRASESDPLIRLEVAVREGIDRIEHYRTQARIEEPSLLNLALCDGERAVVSRYISPGTSGSNSLYVRAGREFECMQRVCGMQDEGAAPHAAIVASEPLTSESGWEPVPEGHLVRLVRGEGFDIVAL